MPLTARRAAVSETPLRFLLEETLLKELLPPEKGAWKDER